MNVNLWFARDANNEIISIVDSNNENTYTCPICASKVIPKALESKKVTPHYAHVDVDKCNSESMLHWWFKHKFIERGDTFKIKTDDEIEYACKDFDTEVTFQLESGTYRPDLVIYTECGQEIVFEMANTDKKKVQDYIDKWIELDKIIVEVDIKSLQNVDEIKCFNALYYKGKCFNFNKRDGGYYNTIGKLKEQMKHDGKYDVNIINKLDWFWNELINYKNNSIEDTFFTYYTIKKKDRQFILDTLKGNTCSSYYSDIFNFEYKYVLNVVHTLIPSNLLSFFEIERLMTTNSRNTESNYGGIRIKNKFTKGAFNNFNYVKLDKLKYYIDTNVRLIIDSNSYQVYCLTKDNNDFKKALCDFTNEINLINENVQLQLSDEISEDNTGLLLVLLHNHYFEVNLGIKILELKTYSQFLSFLKKKLKYLMHVLPNDKENKYVFDVLLNKFENSYFRIITEYSNMIIFQFKFNDFLLMNSCLYKFNCYYSDASFKNVTYLKSALKKAELLAVNLNEIEDIIKGKMTNMLSCLECKNYFKFTYDEQKFYKDKGFNQPKRCKPCRQKRKEHR